MVNNHYFYSLSALFKEFSHKKSKLKKILSNFKSLSHEVNDYLKDRALDDEVNKIAKTFLILNKRKTEILFYFTIMPKPMSVIGLNKGTRVKLLNDDRLSYISTTLLAQLGKSEKHKQELSRNYIWDYIYQEIEMLEFSSKFILVDCHKDLRKYYEKLGFIYLFYDNLNKLHTLIKPINLEGFKDATL